MRRLAALLLVAWWLAGPAAASPGWIEDAVVYGAVPALFGERGLADVTRRLDDIAALGTTVLWLSPVTDAPAGDFGYAVTDHFHLRPSVGTEADLRELVAAAHARGLKVVLDLALNHLSDQHPYYRDLLRRGDASPYRDFFARDASGAVAHYFDWRNLENLNFGNAAVRAYATEAGARWLRDFDIDGFRLDAAWGPRQRDPDFWPGWCAAMRRIKPGILLLAEASERDPYYADAGFDAAYDWTDRLGEWAWHDAFDGAAIAARLRRALAAEHEDLPIFRFLDNNDTGRRFLGRHGAAVTRLALVMLMTLPGIPALYMGEESGAEFEPYGPPAPIAWADPQHWGDYLRRLAGLRHREAALRSHRLILLKTADDNDVLAYLRPGADAAESLLVLINYGTAPAALSIVGEALPMLDGPLLDLLSGARLEPGATLLLPPLTARVLRQARAE